MELQDQLREIKSRFRLAMNGAASRSMREKGLDYRMNFGIELPRLKEIAVCYPKSHRLAQALWKEEIRESKILAGLLQPVEEFIPELADMWVEEMRYPEIAEQTCMNLFQYLPYASQKTFKWIADERPYFQACGYLLLARFFTKGLMLNERSEEEYLDQAAATLMSPPPFPRRTALASLRRFVRLGREQEKKALDTLAPLAMSSRPEERALYEEVRNETEEI